MKKLLSGLILILLCLQISALEEQVYFARSIQSADIHLSGFIIEDHIAYKQNINTWGNSETGINYESYINYIKDIVKKYSSYNDTVREYYIEGWKNEFSKLTNIKPKDAFFISSPDKIYEVNISGYYINIDDGIGGGVLFYPAAKYLPRNYMPDYEILVCSPQVLKSKIDLTGITDKKTLDKFKSKLLPLLKNVKYSDWETGKEKWKEVRSISDDEIKVFKGNFTGKVNQYLVCYTKRLSFDAFASAILIMDENGKVILEPSQLIKSDFMYLTAIGTADYNNDGILELIIEIGYYEGRGYELWKYSKDLHITIASGFNFGV